MLVERSLRTISSCSGWIVETMSRIGPALGLSISAARIALWSVVSPWVRRSSSYAVRRPPVDAEPSAQLDAHRVGRGGAVEGGRDRCPPVDDDGVPAVVGDVPTPDVERLDGVGGANVDAAEEQRGARVVGERRHSPGEDASEAARSSTRRRPSRRRGGRPPRASGAAGHGRGRGEPARGPGRRWRVSPQPVVAAVAVVVSVAWAESADCADTAEPPLVSGLVRILANRRWYTRGAVVRKADLLRSRRRDHLSDADGEAAGGRRAPRAQPDSTVFFSASSMPCQLAPNCSACSAESFPSWLSSTVVRSPSAERS